MLQRVTVYIVRLPSYPRITKMTSVYPNFIVLQLLINAATEIFYNGKQTLQTTVEISAESRCISYPIATLLKSINKNPYFIPPCIS